MRSKRLLRVHGAGELELRLRNASTMPIEIDARLAPEFGNVAVFIRRPDGRS